MNTLLMLGFTAGCIALIVEGVRAVANEGPRWLYFIGAVGMAYLAEAAWKRVQAEGRRRRAD